MAGLRHDVGSCGGLVAAFAHIVVYRAHEFDELLPWSWRLGAEAARIA
jgi:hypothetical protein